MFGRVLAEMLKGNALHCSTVKYLATVCNVVFSSAVLCSAVMCSGAPCSAVQRIVN